MARTIQLNREMRFSTEEIYDPFAYRNLPAKF